MPLVASQTTQTPLTTKRVFPSEASHVQHPPSDAQKEAMYRSGFVRLGPDKAPLVNKYHSIHTLQDSEKIAALKDTKLNPNLIEDGYDQLAHAMHLWTVVGNKAKNMSPEEQQRVAAGFYDKVVGPAYGHMKLAPMDKQLWLKAAYSSALDYKIEDAYTNNLAHSLMHGWASGGAAVGRAGLKLTNILGNTLDDAVAMWRTQQAERAKPDAERQVFLKKPWHEQFAETHNQIASVPHKETKAAEPWRELSEKAQFAADTLPAHDGFLNKTTSFVAEQVAQLPIYAILGEGAGLAKGASLTARLSTSPAGRWAMGTLLAGAEGLAYGEAVRTQDDPGERWRDAIGFATFHNIFNVAGMGMKKFMDVAPESMMPQILRRKEVLELSQKGMRPATPVEQYEDHKTEVANNLFVVGVPGQRAIYVDALHHIQEMESTNMSPQAISAYRKRMLDPGKGDPARWAPVFAAAKFIKSALGKQRLSDVVPGSPEEAKLSAKLAKLIVDAGSEMNTRVKGMSEISEGKAQKLLAAPSAKHTLEYYINKVKDGLAKNPGAAALVTPEQIQKAALKKYAEDLHSAAEESEKQLGPPSTEKAKNVAERRKDLPPPAMKIKSERTVSRGQISVRYDISPDYKVQLKKHAAAAKSKGQSLSEYFEDLSDEDFVHDLSQYFYPKALGQAKVFFENQHTKEGVQNPNFLAFMYNYRNQMPKQFADVLKDRLTNTVKAQKYMSGRKPLDPQLDYYAKAMYNHVDNFLGSGRWPKESNLFRSSNENIFKTTGWQRSLLVEKTLQEQTNLKSMFSNNPKALKLALATHGAFAKLRMNEFKQAVPERNSQEILQAYDHVIADLQTQTKKYERWDY